MSKLFRDIDTLKFDPANSRKHDERNIKAIMDSLKQHGQRKPIVIYSDMVVAGNGTLEAAKRLGWTEIWVNNDPFESLEAAKAYALQDNRSAELASWNDEQLAETLEELKNSGWDLDEIGFNDSDIKELNQDESENIYTKKIEAPIYNVTGDCPRVSDLFDKTKHDQLVSEIKTNKKLSDDVKTFLEYAAARHIVFNYQNIAEFYAHADKETQEFMEKSALIIIDFDKAIESGFVEMSQDIVKIYESDYDEL